jgi:hypothetical protein
MTKDEALLFVIDVLENHVEDPRSENLIEKTIKLCKEVLKKPMQDEEDDMAFWERLESEVNENGY